MEILDEDSIRLPKGVGTSPLSLSEIGAVCCLLCMFAPEPEEEKLAVRMKTPEMSEAVKSLMERGVVKMEMEGKTLRIKVDLGPLA